MKQFSLKIKKLPTVSFLILLLGGLPFSALAEQKPIAQSSELRAAVESVSESLKDDVATEAEASREALQKIFELTQAEIDELASKERLLEASADTRAEIATLASYHLRALRSHSAYIDLLERQIARPEIELSELKIIASDFKSWRSKYESHAKEVFDFLMLLQANTVLKTAQARLELVAADVQKIGARASKADAKIFAQHLSGAEKSLNTASTYQSAAEKELLKLQADNLTAEPIEVSLQQGVGGSFTCISANSFIPSACTPVFRLINGQYYLLKPSAEFSKTNKLADLHQVSGTLLAMIPNYGDYVIIATIEVTAINDAGAAVVLPAEKVVAEDEKIAKPANENFRKSVRAATLAVLQTYNKYFFAMSKIAQRY